MTTKRTLAKPEEPLRRRCVNCGNYLAFHACQRCGESLCCGEQFCDIHKPSRNLVEATVERKDG